jgi:hypothetical protein
MTGDSYGADDNSVEVEAVEDVRGERERDSGGRPPAGMVPGSGGVPGGYDPPACPECGYVLVMTAHSEDPWCLRCDEPRPGSAPERPEPDVPVDERCMSLGSFCAFCGAAMPEPDESPRRCSELSSGGGDGS